MAVVTEGDSANSYVSVDQATEYHAQRGNAAWRRPPMTAAPRH